jgi:hypothetical protein
MSNAPWKLATCLLAVSLVASLLYLWPRQESTAQVPAPDPKKPGPAAPTAKEPVPNDPVAAARKVREILNRPSPHLRNGIDPGTPLKEALDYIAKNHGLAFRIDYRSYMDGLHEGPEQVHNKKVWLPASEHLPLRVCLRDLLKQVESEVLIQGNYVTVAYYLVGANVGGEDVIERAIITVDAEMENRPLVDALEELAARSGANIVLDVSVGDRGQTSVSCNIQNVPIAVAVRLLADMAGLKMVAVSNVLYVTTREKAADVYRDTPPP